MQIKDYRKTGLGMAIHCAGALPFTLFTIYILRHTPVYRYDCFAWIIFSVAIFFILCFWFTADCTPPKLSLILGLGGWVVGQLMILGFFWWMYHSG